MDRLMVMDAPPSTSNPDSQRMTEDFIAQQKLAERRGLMTILRVAAIFAGVVAVGALTGIFTKSTAGGVSTTIVLGSIGAFFNYAPRRRAYSLFYLGPLNTRPTDYRALMANRAPGGDGVYRSAEPPAAADGDEQPITRWTD